MDEELYKGCNAIYLDVSNMTLNHRILNVCEIDAESIDNVQLQKFFNQAFKEWGIDTSKIITFVIDGGSNQWLTLKHMGIVAIWCGCHSIATVVKVGLGVCDAFMKPKTLVTWFMSTQNVYTRIKVSESDYIEHIYIYWFKKMTHVGILGICAPKESFFCGLKSKLYLLSTK
jgi:hypothetical protein